MYVVLAEDREDCEVEMRELLNEAGKMPELLREKVRPLVDSLRP